MASKPFSAPLKRVNSAAMADSPASKRLHEDSEAGTCDTDMEDINRSPTTFGSQMKLNERKPVMAAIREASYALLKAIEKAEAIYGFEMTQNGHNPVKRVIREVSDAMVEAIQTAEALDTSKGPRNEYEALKAGFEAPKLWPRGSDVLTRHLKTTQVLYSPQCLETPSFGEKVTYENDYGETIEFIEHWVYAVLEKKWLNGRIEEASIAGLYPTLREAAQFARDYCREHTDIDDPDSRFAEEFVPNGVVRYYCIDDKGCMAEYTIEKMAITEKDQEEEMVTEEYSEEATEEESEEELSETSLPGSSG